MKTRDLIKIIQEDYDILCKSDSKYRCCAQTIKNLVEHLGGEIIDGKVMIPISLKEFRERKFAFDPKHGWLEEDEG